MHVGFDAVCKCKNLCSLTEKVDFPIQNYFLCFFLCLAVQDLVVVGEVTLMHRDE